MYRLLNSNNTGTPRQKVRRHPKYVKPELVATGPNQVWTWDITYLKTWVRGRFLYLYVVIDIYSRYVVGWHLATCESPAVAQNVLSSTIQKHGLIRAGLTLHSDRGVPMTSQPVTNLLEKLGVDRSLSRPRVSNDNPYSEAGFRTLKYCSEFPDRFSDKEQANQFCRWFFDKYNNVMHHSGIALLTPHQVHYGEAQEVLSRRQATLDEAYAKTPGRFGGRRPSAGKLPRQVWINAPALDVSAAEPAA